MKYFFLCHCIFGPPQIQRHIYNETKCISIRIKSLCLDEFLHPTGCVKNWYVLVRPPSEPKERLTAYAGSHYTNESYD